MNNADYQSAFDAGRKRATCWFAQHGYSMAVFRDLERAKYASSLAEPFTNGITRVCEGFDILSIGFSVHNFLICKCRPP